MTKQQLAKFHACFDNCLINHPTHTWFEATVEGFNAATGQSILTLNPEEESACKEFAEALQYKDESYNRDKAVLESHAAQPVGIDGCGDLEDDDEIGYIKRPQE